MRPSFHVQWHITNSCDKNCTHCYMLPEERNSRNDLSTKEIERIIDEIVDFASLINAEPTITYTGGNPLLRDDLFEILNYTKNKSIETHILGNPKPLNADLAKKLFEHGVVAYQLSLDGLKDIHDSYRGEGSFEEVDKAIDILKEARIKPTIMCTVSKKNCNDIPELARYAAKKQVARFDFARLVPIGCGKNLEDTCFTPIEYKNFIQKMYDTYMELFEQGVPRNTFGTKDTLWTLFLHEKGLLGLPEKDKLIYTGCGLSKNGICIDADGRVYGCRRMPISLGNIKDNSIRNLFLNNKEMNFYRNYDTIEGCNNCDLMQICRGCRAVAWAVNGLYSKRDPQCWKQII